MISVPADIAGQSKHAADWLDERKEQGPSPVLARAKRQLEELEVDWADAFAVPGTESVTVPRPKKKRTEEPAATSHLPPAISASHTAKPPHPPGKVLAQKTPDQRLMAEAAHRVQRQAEQAKKKEDEAKKKKKEEDDKRKKKEKDEEEKRKKKEREKKEREEEEKRRKKAEEEKAEKVMQRALLSSLHVLCISSRVLCSVLRVLCLCYASALLFPGIKASTEAACPSPRPATRTRRSVRFHPTQYGSQGQAAGQSRRGQGGKGGAHAAPRLVLQRRPQASVDHLLHHCDRADDCGGSRNQASRRQEGPSGPRGRHHPQRSVEPQPTRGGGGGRGRLVGVHALLPGVLRQKQSV